KLTFLRNNAIGYATRLFKVRSDQWRTMKIRLMRHPLPPMAGSDSNLRWHSPMQTSKARPSWRKPLLQRLEPHVSLRNLRFGWDKRLMGERSELGLARRACSVWSRP